MPLSEGDRPTSSTTAILLVCDLQAAGYVYTQWRIEDLRKTGANFYC
jgi:hypothetical protein